MNDQRDGVEVASWPVITPLLAEDGSGTVEISGVSIAEPSLDRAGRTCRSARSSTRGQAAPAPAPAHRGSRWDVGSRGSPVGADRGDGGPTARPGSAPGSAPSRRPRPRPPMSRRQPVDHHGGHGDRPRARRRPRAHGVAGAGGRRTAADSGGAAGGVPPARPPLDEGPPGKLDRRALHEVAPSGFDGGRWATQRMKSPDEVARS